MYGAGEISLALVGGCIFGLLLSAFILDWGLPRTQDNAQHARMIFSVARGHDSPWHYDPRPVTTGYTKRLPRGDVFVDTHNRVFLSGARVGIVRGAFNLAKHDAVSYSARALLEEATS